LELVFSRFERFSELPFQDGEYSFNLVSLMILIQIKRLSNQSSVIPRDSFPSSVSDWDKRTGVERIPDQFMDLFGIISFIHDIKIRMSDPMALFQEFFGMRDIMDRMLGDL
jgi:hypothetical protein